MKINQVMNFPTLNNKKYCRENSGSSEKRHFINVTGFFSSQKAHPIKSELPIKHLIS